MEDLVQKRLKGRSGSGLLNGLSQALFFAGTGNVLPEAAQAEDDSLERALQLQRLQTGSPEFQMQLATAKSDIDTQKFLDQYKLKEDLAAAELARKQEAYKTKMGGGTAGPTLPPQGQGFAPQAAPSQALQQAAMVNPLAGAMDQGVPMFLQKPSRQVWRDSMEMPIEEPGEFIPNPEYLGPKDRAELAENQRARTAQEESAKQQAEQLLKNIQEAKQGAKYFGPFGNLPSVLAPSSLDGEYDERAKWEANMNQLLATEVLKVLDEMKKASSTGASGLGAMNEKELDTLAQASTALKKTLGGEDALRLLNEMEVINKKFLNPNSQNDFSKMSDDELRRILAS